MRCRERGEGGEGGREGKKVFQVSQSLNQEAYQLRPPFILGWEWESLQGGRKILQGGMSNEKIMR